MAQVIYVDAAAAWADADLDALKVSPEVAWYMADRGHFPPDCPPKIKTPEPRDAPGAVFDPEAVDKVLAAFHQLRHVKGVHAGKPLDPDSWQIAYIIAPIFGWVSWDEDADAYVRIITTGYVDLPRKNGKTTIAGGIGIYMTAADGEMGAQVVCAATTRDQAGFAFEPIKQLAKGAPGLKRYVQAFSGKVVHPMTASYMQPVANVGDAQHGADLHCAIVDELHLHKDNVLIEALTTGTGSRSQPLIFFITTADAGAPNTPYDEYRRLVEQLARGALTDHNTYGVVFGALSDQEAEAAGVEPDDPFSEATWKKANPGYGKSPTRRYLREMAAKAQNSPAQFASFQRLHLGLRTKQLTKWITLDDWKANAGTGIDPEALRDMECWGGLDLSATSDVTALCWVFPTADMDRYRAVWRMWLPEAQIEDLNRRTSDNASVWVRNGWLTLTPGNVVDYDYVKADILTDMERYDVRALAYDRWNSSQLVSALDSEGVPMVGMGQGYASMSPPLKQLQRLVRKGAATGVPCMEHAGNPVINWMMDNLAVATDPAGNVKPDKASAAEKIDGVAALVMGVAGAVEEVSEGDSLYENEELEFG